MTALEELKLLLAYQAEPTEGVDVFFNRALHHRIASQHFQKPARLQRAHTLSGWALVPLADKWIDVIVEPWSLTDLAQHFPPIWHQKNEPADEKAALIIFRGWGRICLIDGYTRLNSWLAKNNTGPHRA